MACNIGFTDFRGHESVPGQGLTSLVMRGTATECSRVCVTLRQTQPTIFQTTERCVDVINGAWEVTFTVVTDFPAGTFRCGRGNKVVPQVSCADDPSCVLTNFDNFNSDTIACDDCPELDFSIASVAIGGCNPNGTRTVTFNGTVTSLTGAATAVTHIEVVASGVPSTVLGNSAPTIGAAGSVPLVAFSINLASGSYIARLRVDSPVGCAALEVPFTVDACALPVVCPSGVIAATIGDCDASGTRSVTVTATLTRAPDGPITAILKNPANPTGAALATGTSTTGALVLTSPANFRLAPGNYEVQAEVTSPGGCPTIRDDLIVNQCDGTPPPPPRDPEPDPEPQPSEGFGCALLRILGLALVIIGFVLSVAGVATANPVLCGVGLGLGLLGAFLLFLWLVFCAADAGCRALQSMIQLVELLLWLIAIAALLGLVTGNFPCVGFLLGQGVAIGILLARMYNVFVTRPCRWQPGFFGRG